MVSGTDTAKAQHCNALLFCIKVHFAFRRAPPSTEGPAGLLGGHIPERITLCNMKPWIWKHNLYGKLEDKVCSADRPTSFHTKGILKPKGLVTWPPAYGLTLHHSQKDLPKHQSDHRTPLFKNPSMRGASWQNKTNEPTEQAQEPFFGKLPKDLLHRRSKPRKRKLWDQGDKMQFRRKTKGRTPQMKIKGAPRTAV